MNPIQLAVPSSSRNYIAIQASAEIARGAEDEPAARAAGVRVWLQRLIAFVLSAFVVGIGGILYGHF